MAVTGSLAETAPSAESSFDGGETADVLPRAGSAWLHKRLSLLVVDDCVLRRECVVEELATRGAEVARSWDMNSFGDAFRQWRADVILINQSMPEAQQIVESVVAAGLASRVIVYGLMAKDDTAIVSYAGLGVSGYHLRSESMDDLVTYIGRVAEGGSGCSSRVSAILLRRFSQLSTNYPESPAPGQLTEREAEVLALLELGLSNQQIAARLHIATHTVKNHVHNVLNKLGARSRSEAAAMARRSGLPNMSSRNGGRS